MILPLVSYDQHKLDMYYYYYPGYYRRSSLDYRLDPREAPCFGLRDQCVEAFADTRFHLSLSDHDRL